MPRTTPVRDVMTTDVLTFRPEDPIQEASQRLVERDVDGAPVVDDQGRVVGMFTTDDLLVQETRLHYPTVFSLFGAYLELPSSHRKFEEDLRRAVAATVADVMHDDPVSCGPDDTLERVATVMHEEKLGRLPVIEGGRLIGIVARGDILRSIMAAPGE
ncbi:MAG TPA: CBS domain-containing protein [Acidimicrobiales bacterium]|jgi:CBS domain-containing protein|nr:CBS domain-containing protein [Acidimicrobiales bacterium]